MPPQKKAVNEAIGRAIRNQRTEQGYTQEAFALQAGIDRSYIGAIERGEFNLTLETLLKIATGLNTTGAELMSQAGL